MLQISCFLNIWQTNLVIRGTLLLFYRKKNIDRKWLLLLVIIIASNY